MEVYTKKKNKFLFFFLLNKKIAYKFTFTHSIYACISALHGISQVLTLIELTNVISRKRNAMGIMHAFRDDDKKDKMKASVVSFVDNYPLHSRHNIEGDPSRHSLTLEQEPLQRSEISVRSSVSENVIRIRVNFCTDRRQEFER